MRGSIFNNIISQFLVFCWFYKSELRVHSIYSRPLPNKDLPKNENYYGFRQIPTSIKNPYEIHNYFHTIKYISCTDRKWKINACKLDLMVNMCFVFSIKSLIVDVVIYLPSYNNCQYYYIIISVFLLLRYDFRLQLSTLIVLIYNNLAIACCCMRC